MSKLETRIDHDREAYYREKGFWGDATLLDFWRMSLKRVPDKTCVIDNRGGS